MLKHGYILKEHYQTMKNKHFFIDKYGYKYFATLDNIICLNRKARKFGKHNPFTFDNLQNFIYINNSNSQILDIQKLKYINQKQVIKIKCEKCNEIFETRIDKVINNKKFLCNSCSLKIKGINSRISKQDVENYFKKYKYYPDMSQYINTDTEIDIYDEEGYKYKSSYHSFKVSNNLFRFYKNNVYSIDNIKNYLKINNIKAELISKEYYNNVQKLKFKCNCGKIFYADLNQIKTTKRRCSSCLGKMSYFEKEVEQILIDNNIRYIYEYSFDDCKNEYKLRFDFAIIDDKNILLKLIELDGEQHRIPCRFGGRSIYESKEALKKQLIRDDIKNNYCKKNNYKLLRVPYKYFRNGKYIDIIKNFLLNV